MHDLFRNDPPTGYPDSYYVATAHPTPERKRLDGDRRCEICVIGGGFTGLSAALHLAEQGRSVVMIDARRVGWGASGRNGGQLGSGQRAGQETIESWVGLENAKRMWGIAEEAKALVRALAERFDIACDLKPGKLHVDHRARYSAHTRDHVTRLNQIYGYDQIRYVERDELREMLGAPQYFSGSLDRGAGHLHPLNFALGLGRAAEAAGATLYENTPALALKPGAPNRIETPRGAITADRVVLGCNGYLGDLAPSVAARVMPINNFVIATEPFSETDARALIRDDVCVADSRFVVNYFRLSADRRLLFGGGETYSYRFPADIKSFVRRPMLDVFPQLAEARIDYGWGGTLAITAKRMPHYAWPADNVISASGFSGHGVGMATLAGAVLAEALGGDRRRFDAFARIKATRFPGGGALRWPLLALAMTWYAFRDRL